MTLATIQATPDVRFLVDSRAKLSQVLTTERASDCSINECPNQLTKHGNTYTAKSLSCELVSLDTSGTESLACSTKILSVDATPLSRNRPEAGTLTAS
jgi:hypothetical protein